MEQILSTAALDTMMVGKGPSVENSNAQEAPGSGVSPMLVFQVQRGKAVLGGKGLKS